MKLLLTRKRAFEIIFLFYIVSLFYKKVWVPPVAQVLRSADPQILSLRDFESSEDHQKICSFERRRFVVVT